MLDFRVETFLAVCQTRNFTRAAQSLHITQPAVSQHIHALEEEFGVKLFRYEGRQLSLTPAGRLLQQTAATMRHDVRHLREEIRQLSRRRAVRFGATLTVGEYVMPEALCRLLEREPDLQLRMLVANTAELLALLDRGEIDFAVVEGFFSKQSYDSLPYRRVRYLPVRAPGLPGSAPVRGLEDLLGERLLVREPGSGTREVLEHLLEEVNLTIADFRRVTEVGSLGAIKAMACAGAGVAFFYEPVVRAELEAGTLEEIPIPGLAAAHDFAFLWRKGSVYAPRYREMFRLLSGGEPRKNDCNSSDPVIE